MGYGWLPVGEIARVASSRLVLSHPVPIVASLAATGRPRRCDEVDILAFGFEHDRDYTAGSRRPDQEQPPAITLQGDVPTMADDLDIVGSDAVPRDMPDVQRVPR